MHNAHFDFKRTKKKPIFCMNNTNWKCNGFFWEANIIRLGWTPPYFYSIPFSGDYVTLKVFFDPRENKNNFRTDQMNEITVLLLALPTMSKNCLENVSLGCLQKICQAPSSSRTSSLFSFPSTNCKREIVSSVCLYRCV